MHASTDVDVYLSIPSNPIIEHSSSIRFAAYPTSLYLPEQPTSVSVCLLILIEFPSDLSKPNLQNNKYTSVQDFSHIRPTQSPNWCIMPDETRRDNWFELSPREDRAIGKMLD